MSKLIYEKKITLHVVVFSLFLLLAPAHGLASTETLSNRLTLELDNNGQLVVNNYYLTHYILRGKNSLTGEVGGMRFIRPSQKAVDYNVVDIEFEGLLPKLDWSWPSFESEKTTVSLSGYTVPGTTWKDTDLIFRGASLYDLAGDVYYGRLEGKDAVDSITVFLLNTLTLTETSISVVHKLDSAGVDSASLIGRIEPIASSVASYKELLSKAGLLADISMVWREVGQGLALELGYSTDTDPRLQTLFSYHDVLIDAIQRLSAISGSADGLITAGKKGEVRGTIAKQYSTLLGDVRGATDDAILKQVAALFAESYRDADDAGKAVLLARYFVEPMGQTLALIQGDLERELNALKKSSSASNAEIKAKEDEINLLRNGRAAILLASLLYNGPEIYNRAIDDPGFIVPFLFELGSSVAGTVFTADNSEIVAKQAWQKYTRLDGRHSTFGQIRKWRKSGDSFMKGIAAGGVIGNRLIPLIWDIVLAPNQLKTSLVDGSFSPYGQLESNVYIDRQVGHGVDQQIAELDNQNTQIVIPMAPNQKIRIGVGLNRPLQFDATRAPWEVNPSLPPQPVYDVLITSPQGYSQSYLCARRILGNRTFAFYNNSGGGSWSITPRQCGVGDLLGREWFDGSKLGSTIYGSVAALPASLKMAAPESTLNTMEYTYQGTGKDTILIQSTGMSGGRVTQRIILVPELANVGFSYLLGSSVEGSQRISVDASQVVASASDPIVRYIWSWGDGTPNHIATDAVATHSYQQSGSYMIELEMITESGAVTRYQQWVSVDEDSSIDRVTYLSTAVGDGSITVSWAGVEGATSYNLYHATESGLTPDNYAAFANGQMVIGASSPHTLSGLANGTTYYIVVTAISGGAEGPASDQVNAMPVLTASMPTGLLNDTGIDWCANATTNNLACPVASFANQDGDHGRDAQARAGTLTKVGAGAAGFDFTKLDANGNTLAANASSWSCVRDNVTGLIWEVKTNDGGLRDMNHTYTWYNPDNTRNGGDAGVQNGGTCTGSDCDTQAFMQAVNAQGLCGASDWRVPSRLELMSIVHNGRVEPAIDTGYFPHTFPYTPAWSWFWSSSPFADYSYGAWGVYFGNGAVHNFSKLNSVHVRLVRAGQ